MPAALALSPHLDDAAFSCGATLARLVDAGWHVTVATVFTASIPNPAGFALACQTDKGLPPDADYMAVRRAEDRDACALLGVTDIRWLGLPEAPHRGYHSAPALFAGILPGDAIWQELAPLVSALRGELQPDVVFAPQGLGNHVDHLHMIQALHAAPGPGTPLYYRDTPYAIRNPGAVPHVSLRGLASFRVGASAGLDRKVAASAAYATQIGYQFGGPDALARSLRAFAAEEGAGTPAEQFLGDHHALAAIQP